jgi:hypothetical protein
LERPDAGLSALRVADNLQAQNGATTMRQTLTLLGTIRSMSIHPGSVRETPREIIRRLFDVHLCVEENYPGTSSRHRIEAALRDAERPQHRAIFQARPGDRVELVGY